MANACKVTSRRTAKKAITWTDVAQANSPTEFRGAPTTGPAVIAGAMFTNKSVTHYEVGGMALGGGNIALGSVDNIKQETAVAQMAATSDSSIAYGVGHQGQSVPLTELPHPRRHRPTLTNQQRVPDAVAHWERLTVFRFLLRSVQVIRRRSQTLQAASALPLKRR